MNMIKVRVVRPIFLYGARVDAGREVFMAPADAASGVSARRCEYVNPDDRDVVNAAVRAEDAKLKGPNFGQHLREWVHACEHS